MIKLSNFMLFAIDYNYNTFSEVSLNKFHIFKTGRAYLKIPKKKGQ